jgi:predicted nucleotidyltransferase
VSLKVYCTLVIMSGPRETAVPPIERLRTVLGADPRIAYAAVFGSSATARAHANSDVDLAIGLVDGPDLDVLDLGALTASLEAAAGRPVDLVLLEEAPPGLAYRVFRDGHVIVTRDPRALARRRARAILEYLDFRPIEELFTRGVLAARGGR